LKTWNRARWLQKPLTLKEVHENYLKAWADNT
jgi:putative RecB family exonuclease